MNVRRGLQPDAEAEHEILGRFEVAEAVTGVYVEVTGDEGLQRERLVEARFAARVEHLAAYAGIHGENRSGQFGVGRESHADLLSDGRSHELQGL